MMKSKKIFPCLLLFLLLMTGAGCGGTGTNTERSKGMEAVIPVTESTKISEVINDPLFGDCGRLLFPVDNGYYGGDTLGSLSLTWYSNISPARTVAIVNYLREQAAAGRQIFYKIY